jgi:hypothetical protein
MRVRKSRGCLGVGPSDPREGIEVASAKADAQQRARSGKRQCLGQKTTLGLQGDRRPEARRRRGRGREACFPELTDDEPA